MVNQVSPWLTGSCIEDVNHEIYGGLYDQKIFGESFEEPPAAAKFEGWTAYGGFWHMDGAACRVDADPGGKLVRDAPDFTDGTVEADIRLPESRGDNAGLLVRVGNAGVGADNFDGYEISLSASGQQLIFGKHRHDWHPLKAVAASVAPGQWHHLRVVLEGSHVRIFLDGGADPLIDFTDTDTPFLSGKIALRTWNVDAAFQNVRIQTGPTTIENQFHVTGGEAISGMWDVVRDVNAIADFALDNGLPYNGRQCQKFSMGLERDR